MTSVMSISALASAAPVSAVPDTTAPVGSLPVDKRKSWLYPAIALAVFWPVLYFIVQYFMT